MSEVAIGLIVLWIVAVVFLFGRSTYLFRAVLENFSPNPLWGPREFLRDGFLYFRYRLTAKNIAPESLTELGQEYRRKALLNDRILTIVGMGGFLVLVCYHYATLPS